MATSGTVTYSLDARAAITTALELTQTCMIGATADPNAAALAMKHANLMLKTWSIEPRLWIMTEGSQVLTAAVGSYALTGVRRVTSVRRRTGTGANVNDTPLLEMSRSEYYDYPSKAASGQPFQYYFDPQRTTRTLYLINVPGAAEAASTTLQYTYLRVIEDISDLANDIDVPQEWLEAFIYALAARLLIPYAKFVTDPITASKIEERASTLYAQLTDSSQEDGSVFFQPA